MVFDWVVGILALGALTYTTCILPSQWLRVVRVQIPLQLGVKMIQISDIHIKRNRIPINTLLRIVRAEQPDVICLTGDFVDDDASIPALARYLAPIAELDIPLFAVLGNHDYFVKDIKNLLDVLRAARVDVLRNEIRTFDRFQIVGIDDYCSRHSDARILSAADPAKPIIVLTHDPTITLYLRDKYDYLLSGHLHGRQFAVPFLFRIRDFGPLAASGIYQGLHRSSKGLYYISKGIGQSAINIRFLVRSEITIHEL